MITSLNNVFYPPVGIAHVLSDISDLVVNRLSGKSKIEVNCSSQPNSHPHLGSVTTFMTAFAIASHLRNKLQLPASVTFDALENAPGEKKVIGRIEYQRSLADVYDGTTSLSVKYMATFEKLFEELSILSSIPYEIKPYGLFQKQKDFRKALVHIFSHKEIFTRIISPSRGHLRLRFPCPHCSWTDKAAKRIRLQSISEDKSTLIFEAECFEHGKHHLELSAENNQFVDTNTALRSIAKGVQLIEEGKKEKKLIVMVDGKDWSGEWAYNIFSLGLSEFGYNVSDFPIRYFAPLIVDWSGSKFSKSLYLKSDAYRYLPQGLIDFSQFRSTYGAKGFENLWNEVKSWTENPKKFFRDYSVDYFKLLLKKK